MTNLHTRSDRRNRRSPFRGPWIEPLESRIMLDGSPTMTADINELLAGMPVHNYVVLKFSEPVSGVTLSDFTLITSGTNLLTGGQAITAIDSQNYVLTGLTVPVAGDMTLTLAHPENITNAADEAATPYTLTWTQATTQTILDTPPALVLHGDPVVLHAHVNSTAGVVQGEVDLFEGDVTLASGFTDTSGDATLSISTLSAGLHTFSVRYAGDVLNGRSTDVSVTPTQILIGNTTTALTLSSPTTVQGQSVTLSATVSSNLGTAHGVVDFYFNTTLFAAQPLVNQVATVTTTLFPPATYSLRAVFVENADLHTSASSTKSLTVKNNGLPIGAVTSLSTTNISGWAYDFDTPGDPVVTYVAIDGNVRGIVLANVHRTDLGFPALADHGFSIPLNLPVGTHHVQVYALNAPSVPAPGNTILLDDTTITNAPAFGVVQAANTHQIVGYALDPDSPATPVTMLALVDNVFLPVFTANIARPDLSRLLHGAIDHGFGVMLPALSVGTHKVDLFAIDSSSGAVSWHQTVTLTQPNSAPVAALLSFDGHTLIGYAFDPDITGAAKIRIDIDGGLGTIFPAQLAAPAAPGFSGNHGFSLTLPALPKGPAHIELYVYDSTTNLPTLFALLKYTVT